ncbi:delta subunit of the central stalk of mitochondrial F1F0 ATP synthase, atp16 [Coelomomyces lativittatus]|nr:delta subunit of the central stalk of mitochondrial F1F0 ATP synthase, atp16 [Coelomomyces lativittatus]KAJ1517688.1 delta subunit of the central stalk of mitochondrial F1F0 ATP synthase, atp16 [Coelomomyces lativittatus]
MLRNLLGHGFRRVLTPSLRQYATEAPAASSGQGKLILNLVLPHQSLIHKKPVHQVNLSSTSGDMGILANHVPIIEELRPGVLEVIELNQNKTKYFGMFSIITLIGLKFFNV